MNAPESWQEEKQSAHLYRVLAEYESGTHRERLFRQLAEAADSQARHWEGLAERAGITLAGYRPSLRVRLVGGLLRRLGPRRMLTVLAAMKVRGLSVYTHPLHGGHALPVSGKPEKQHLTVTGGGNLRAAIFGVNDGLVSNLSLIMGVGGAAFSARAVFLSGLAGLMAGAFSMAAGEYVSMRSQREMFEYQIGLEQEELEAYPQEEARELSLIYEARGLEPAQAQYLAGIMMGEPGRALDTLAREELGLNPQELGAPWGAACASFLSFALGAVVPLLPFFIGARPALAWCGAVTGVALFLVGAATSLFTGRTAAYAGARMLAIGALAAAVTFLIGRLLGGVIR